MWAKHLVTDLIHRDELSTAPSQWRVQDVGGPNAEHWFSRRHPHQRNRRTSLRYRSTNEGVRHGEYIAGQEGRDPGCGRRRTRRVGDPTRGGARRRWGDRTVVTEGG